MRLPKKIRIFGKIFNVVYDDIEKEHSLYVFGRMDRAHQKIYIDNHCHRGQQEEALIHEIIEVIDTAHELNLEHNKICTLSQGVYQVLNDNGFLKDK